MYFRIILAQFLQVSINNSGSLFYSHCDIIQERFCVPDLTHFSDHKVQVLQTTLDCSNFALNVILWLNHAEASNSIRDASNQTPDISFFCGYYIISISRPQNRYYIIGHNGERSEQKNQMFRGKWSKKSLKRAIKVIY
jgi:hypothetical protein